MPTCFYIFIQISKINQADMDHRDVLLNMNSCLNDLACTIELMAPDSYDTILIIQMMNMIMSYRITTCDHRFENIYNTDHVNYYDHARLNMLLCDAEAKLITARASIMQERKNAFENDDYIELKDIVDAYESAKSQSFMARQYIDKEIFYFIMTIPKESGITLHDRCNALAIALTQYQFDQLDNIEKISMIALVQAYYDIVPPKHKFWFIIEYAIQNWVCTIDITRTIQKVDIAVSTNKSFIVLCLEVIFRPARYQHHSSKPAI
jgi:hypothetical protein